jgi:hypothetical protein
MYSEVNLSLKRCKFKILLKTFKNQRCSVLLKFKEVTFEINLGRVERG